VVCVGGRPIRGDRLSVVKECYACENTVMRSNSVSRNRLGRILLAGKAGDWEISALEREADFHGHGVYGGGWWRPDRMATRPVWSSKLATMIGVIRRHDRDGYVWGDGLT